MRYQFSIQIHRQNADPLNQRCRLPSNLLMRALLFRQDQQDLQDFFLFFYNNILLIQLILSKFLGSGIDNYAPISSSGFSLMQKDINPS